jgi:hypothetical protein
MAEHPFRVRVRIPKPAFEAAGEQHQPGQNRFQQSSSLHPNLKLDCIEENLSILCL